MADGPAAGAELCWEDWLPVGWRLSPVVSGAELSHLYDAALTRLNAVLTVGEALAAAESSDDAPPRAQDILRLEARLNLLLAMVGELLAAQRPRPPARAVRLGGGWVEWRDPHPPAAGDPVAIELYLNPSIPDPVTLPARVEGVFTCGCRPGRIGAQPSKAALRTPRAPAACRQAAGHAVSLAPDTRPEPPGSAPDTSPGQTAGEYIAGQQPLSPALHRHPLADAAAADPDCGLDRDFDFQLPERNAGRKPFWSRS